MYAATAKQDAADPAAGYEYVLGVLQGRKQPPHKIHVALATNALSRCRHVVLMLGSSNKARDYRNPLVFAERKALMEAIFPAEVASGRLIVVPMPDYYHDNKGWAANVRRIVGEVQQDLSVRHGAKIGDEHTAISGFKKDDTSFYLDLFPEWADILMREQETVLNSTDIRASYFNRPSVIRRQDLHPVVSDFLVRFRRTAAFRRLVDERFEIDHCHEKYPGINHTADLLVTWRGKALMIRRGGRYGHGLIAFPGGIRDPGEDYVGCAFREFGEEMNFFALNPHITLDMLRSFIKCEVYNDDPHRDLRGIYRTVLIHVALPDHFARPKVEPRDDAKKAMLIAIPKIREEECFADHYGLMHEALAKAA